MSDFAAGGVQTRAALHDAAESDLAGIVAIYDEVIANSTAVFANLPVTVEERRRWWQTRTAQGYPVLVARDEHGVAAFGSFGDFRASPGYGFTVEHTLHVRADARGRGIGTQMLHELIERARALGKRVMIAGVDGTMPAPSDSMSASASRAPGGCARWATSSTAGSIWFSYSVRFETGKMAACSPCRPSRAHSFSPISACFSCSWSPGTSCWGCSRSGRRRAACSTSGS